MTEVIKGNCKKVIDNVIISNKQIYKYYIKGLVGENTFSKGHKILAKCYKQGVLLNPDFIKVENINIGDYIGYPINYTEKEYLWEVKEEDNNGTQGQNNPEIKKIKLDKNDYYILGYFIGNDEEDNIGINLGSNTKIYKIYKEIKELKKSFKEIPIGFENDLIENQKEFIKGYIDSNGFINYINSYIKITSIYLPLLKQFQRILLRLGVISIIKEGINGRNNVNGYNIKNNKEYYLYITQGIENIGYNIESKVLGRYEDLLIYIKEGYLWSIINRIEKE